MADRPFYAPAATSTPTRFELGVADELLVGPPERSFMMGGVGLGSAVMALEAATGRPLVWATAQYLSFAQRGQTVEIDVEAAVTGRSVTQARATSRVGHRAILTVNAALGDKGDEEDAQYLPMPEVPPPADCERYEPEWGHQGDLMSRIERRTVEDNDADHPGHARMWMRATSGEPMTAGLLAIFADFLPGAIPITRGSSSLDNTLRIGRTQPAEWCLLDARIQGLGRGFFHGEMSIFSDQGTLLATASQSGSTPRRA